MPPCKASVSLLAGLALCVTGCATIVGGWRDKEVKIASEPPGAAVTVDGQAIGATPAIVKLSRKSDHHVTIAQQGFEPVAMKVDRELNPWILGNIVFGGLVGVLVDVGTNATHTLSPDEIKVTLKPVDLIPSSPVIQQAGVKK